VVGDEDETTTLTHAVPVPADLHHLVKQPKFVLQARLVTGHMVYSRSSTHIGNSLVYFYVDGNRKVLPIPGSIKYILNLNGSVFRSETSVSYGP
jgi:hypothetical protein